MYFLDLWLPHWLLLVQAASGCGTSKHSGASSTWVWSAGLELDSFLVWPYTTCCGSVAIRRSLRDIGVTADAVVVACGVTREDLDDLPYDWLHGNELLLHRHGCLTVTRLVSQEQIDAASEAAQAVYEYAKPLRVSGLRSSRGWDVDLRDFARRACHVALLKYDVYGLEAIPVGVTVIVGSPTCNEMMTTAKSFCHHIETQKRCVTFQIFPPASPSTTELWEVPALAVECEDSDVRMLEIQSFDNAGIPPDVVESLVSGQSFPNVEPLDQERGDMLLKPRDPQREYTRGCRGNSPSSSTHATGAARSHATAT